MACPICKQKKILYSINVKDYEYNLKTSAQYNQCSKCKTIYRNYPKKIKKNAQKNFYNENSYLPLKGGIVYDFMKSMYANYEMKKLNIKPKIDISNGIKKTLTENLILHYWV